jgi:hypothetical protein
MTKVVLQSEMISWSKNLRIIRDGDYKMKRADVVKKEESSAGIVESEVQQSKESCNSGRLFQNLDPHLERKFKLSITEDGRLSREVKSMIMGGYLL